MDTSQDVTGSPRRVSIDVDGRCLTCETPSTPGGLGSVEGQLRPRRRVCCRSRRIPWLSSPRSVRGVRGRFGLSTAPDRFSSRSRLASRAGRGALLQRFQAEHDRQAAEAVVIVVATAAPARVRSSDGHDCDAAPRGLVAPAARRGSPGRESDPDLPHSAKAIPLPTLGAGRCDQSQDAGSGARARSSGRGSAFAENGKPSSFSPRRKTGLAMGRCEGRAGVRGGRTRRCTEVDVTFASEEFRRAVSNIGDNDQTLRDLMEIGAEEHGQREFRKRIADRCAA